MSQSLTSQNVTVFLEEFKLVFQPKIADIKKFCRVQDVKGSRTVEFPVIGRAVTTQRNNYQTPLPLAGVQHSKVICTPTDWVVSDMTDILAQAQVPYDEIRALSETFAMAASRRMLQMLIEALVAAALPKTIAKNITGAADGLNMAMIRKATKLLNQDGVPPEDRIFMAHTNGIHYFTGETQVASSDFNAMRVLNKGQMDSYYGFNFFEVPDLPELSTSGGTGGLPLSAGDRTNFFWQKQAVGLAVRMDPMIRTDYDPSFGGHRTTMMMAMGACVIDPLGAGRCTTDDTKER
jgi:hypothetical protein